MTEWSGETSSRIIQIPIFPLPNVVFFPHTLLPLHIFEPRYRQMVADALEGERQVGMALLMAMREDPASRGADVFTIGGMGEITEVSELEDGKYDILLSGRSRYRILEFTRYKPYRLARVELLEEKLPEPKEKVQLENRLIVSFRELVEEMPGIENIELLEQLDFATLVNLVCSSVNIDLKSKQRLLEIGELQMRANNLLQMLDHLLEQKRFVSRFGQLRPEDPRMN